jgi:hypothetical protein
VVTLLVWVVDSPTMKLTSAWDLIAVGGLKSMLRVPSSVAYLEILPVASWLCVCDQADSRWWRCSSTPGSSVVASARWWVLRTVASRPVGTMPWTQTGPHWRSRLVTRLGRCGLLLGACWRFKIVFKFTASVHVTWCLFHQGGSPEFVNPRIWSKPLRLSTLSSETNITLSINFIQT